jgi:hypothetical protein
MSLPHFRENIFSTIVALMLVQQYCMLIKVMYFGEHESPDWGIDG